MSSTPTKWRDGHASMDYTPLAPVHSASPASPLTPRLIIHGGAGNITRENLPPKLWSAHERALRRINSSAQALLNKPGTSALDAAVHAVQLLELDPLYNAGKGAVFARDGSIELEASVMAAGPGCTFRKRGAAVSLIKHVRSPITLAAEVLRRGDLGESGERGADGGGAGRHEHISGRAAEELAGEWGLEMCDQSYFWTKKRWLEHKRGLQKVFGEKVPLDEGHLQPNGSPWPLDEPDFDPRAYLPQGTVGAVAMDSQGAVAVATSTGGLTNKLPGRIGDTPTFGAGFWAEEWRDSWPLVDSVPRMPAWSTLSTMISQCMPQYVSGQSDEPVFGRKRAVAMSGTGNGDSFLRVSAVRTAAARARFTWEKELAKSVKWMAGPGGELQKSAGINWADGFEGRGGIIGIERSKDHGTVVFDFNCGGMFRCWYDDDGKQQCMVFHDRY